MYSKSQDVAVRRSRRWALVASMLMAGGLCVSEAWADISVNVMNCAQGTVDVNAYDAKDSVRLVAASSKTLSQNQSGSLSCAGQGEGYCQMQFTPASNQQRCYGASPSTVGMHINSGKWAVVKGFQAATSCSPLIEQVDSPPSSEACTQLGIDNN